MAVNGTAMSMCCLAFGLGAFPSQFKSKCVRSLATNRPRRCGVSIKISEDRRSTLCQLTNASDSGAVDSATSYGVVTTSVEIAEGKHVVFETGRVARQAAGSIIVRQGDTMVFCTVCTEPQTSSDIDFMPLRVDYNEKFSSRGRTVGSYMKREGKPTEREVLASRLIDRPLRPMFPKGYCDEVQVLANVFSYDGLHAGDTLAICGSAAALHLSQIPLSKAIAGVRVVLIDNRFVVSPTVPEIEQSETDLVIAGTRDAIMMIEGVCGFLTEDQILEAVSVAHVAIAKLCDALDDLRSKVGKEKLQVEPEVVPKVLVDKVLDLANDLDEAIAVEGKKARESAMKNVENRVFDEMIPAPDVRIQDPTRYSKEEHFVRLAYKRHLSQRLRSKILDTGRRPDGRNLCTVRPISIQQGFLPCAHGSSLFTRGETQALAVATLGGEEMAQRFETLEGEDVARFYLQYSFPPSSVGEVGRVGAPSRREIGHGKLAERALSVVLPSRIDFPYVVRVESSIMESCGSSSMATVCGGCLALMDAGVPIAKPVAGIAMGLIMDKESNRIAILTDILGLEDAFGDMDFKVAGTVDGITALQMDIKVEGITIDIMKKALEQARQGRLHVLQEMKKAQPEPNPTLPSSLPKVETMSIPVKRIGDAIGTGGRNIKSVIEQCGGDDVISISIQADGIVTFSSIEPAVIEKAKALMHATISTVDVGERFDGIVKKVLPFGAYVEFGSGKEGWLHISELEMKRTMSVEDVCKVGDKVRVQVIELGRNGQVRLSRKACLSESSDRSLASGARVIPEAAGPNPKRE